MTKTITSLDQLEPGMTRDGLTYVGWLVHYPPLMDARPDIAICEVRDPATPGWNKLVAFRRAQVESHFINQEVEVPE